MKIHISPNEFKTSIQLLSVGSSWEELSTRKPVSIFRYLFPYQDSRNVEICVSCIEECKKLAESFVYDGENHPTLKRDSVKGALICALLCGVSNEKVNTFSRIINWGDGLKEKPEDYEFFARSFTLIRDFMVRNENVKSFEAGLTICAVIENALFCYDSGKKFPGVQFNKAERIYFNRIMSEGFDADIDV